MRKLTLLAAASVVVAALATPVAAPATEAAGPPKAKPGGAAGYGPGGTTLPDGRPTTPNPYLSFLPAGQQPDHAGWDAYAQQRSEQMRDYRRQQRAAPAGMAQTVVVSESEASGTQNGNDTLGTADPVPGFGTGGGEDPEALISGDVAPPDPPAAVAPPAPAEDDGDITKATASGLALDQTTTVTTETIGDGPHGSAGSGTGDFDFYTVTAPAGSQIVVDVDTPDPFGDLDPFVGLYDSAGNLLATSDDDEVSFDSFLEFTAVAADDYYVSVGGFGSFVLNDPFDSASGPGAGSEGDYDLTLSLVDPDVDVFAVSMDAGDVLGATIVSGAPTTVLGLAPDASLLIGSQQDASFIYPASSPILGGGPHLAIVAETTGTYGVAVAGADGPYELALQAFRPGTERLRSGRSVRLFLDFDGAALDAATLFGGNPQATLSPLSAFLGDWGLGSGSLNGVINQIVATVEENIDADLRTAANGDFDTSGTPGDFDIEILNSRDHPDPFGQPDVSRIVIGGTIDQLGVPTIGIAQSVDPGNFAPGETAVVLLDELSGPCPNPNSLNCIPRATGASMAELIGVAVGSIAAHEAGHFIGSWHTDQFNATPDIMDQGGNLAGTIGLGPDGEFDDGADDDIDVDFSEDVYVPNEGFVGRQSSRNNTAHWLSTGTDTVNDPPVARRDIFPFEGGPLVVGAPGILSNDTDPEFDQLTAMLVDGPDPDLGTLDAFNPDGSLTLTPAALDDITLTYQVSDGDLVSDPVRVTLAVRACADSGVRNGSFELEFDFWCTDDVAAPFVPLDTVGAGFSAGFGFFSTQPTDGDRVAVTGLDGAGPDTVDLWQFLPLPHNTVGADLTFDWRAAWDLITFCDGCTQDRTFEVVVSDALTGAELRRDAVLVAEVGTSTTDTGPQTHTMDLSALAGRLIKVALVGTVPESFTGPAQLQIDNVELDVVVNEAPTAVGDTFTVPLGGTLTVPAAGGLLANDSDPEGGPLTAVLADPPAHGSLDLEPDGSLTYTHDGSATLTDSFSYRASDGLAESAMTGVMLRIGDNEVVRLSGPDRIATAVQISRSSYPAPDSADAVVLTRSDEFADGLAGTPFAHSVNAPLLLTPTASLHPAAEEEIRRVLPDGGEVYVLGGPAAVAPTVQDRLEDLGFAVTRLAGADRFETSVEIAEQLGDVDTILVARAFQFPDALAAGPAAIVSNGAIVLSDEDRPHPVTTAYLDDHPDTDVFGAGGPAARAYPDSTPLAGATRLETAILIANRFFDDPAVAGISRNDVFADALTGGVHVGRAGGPIILSDSVTLPSATFAWLDGNAGSVRLAFLYGGTAALSDDVMDAVGDLIR